MRDDDSDRWRPSISLELALIVIGVILVAAALGARFNDDSPPPIIKPIPAYSK